MNHRHEILQLTGAGLSLIAVCYGLARLAYGLFVPVFRPEFTLDAVAAGGIASGSYISYCIAIIVATVLTPRFGSHIIAVMAGSIATAGILIIAVAPNLLILTIGVLIAGSSTGVASPPLAHVVAHTVQPSARNRTQTIINAGTGVGVAVAGPIALLTYEHWRVAWVAFAIFCILVTIWIARTIPPRPVNRSHQDLAISLLPHPLLPTGSGKLIIAAWLMGFASSAVWVFGRDVLTTAGGMSDSASMITWVFLGIFGVFGAAAGDLSSRFSIRAGWMTTMLAMGVATYLFAAFPNLYGLVWAAAATFGATYIALTGLLLLWGTEVYQQTPVVGVGLAFLTIALGQAAGAPIIGALSEIMSPLAAFTIAALLALAGAFVSPQRPAEALFSS